MRPWVGTTHVMSLQWDHAHSFKPIQDEYEYKGR